MPPRVDGFFGESTHHGKYMANYTDLWVGIGVIYGKYMEHMVIYWTNI